MADTLTKPKVVKVKQFKTVATLNAAKLPIKEHAKQLARITGVRLKPMS